MLLYSRSLAMVPTFTYLGLAGEAATEQWPLPRASHGGLVDTYVDYCMPVYTA